VNEQYIDSIMHGATIEVIYPLAAASYPWRLKCLTAGTSSPKVHRGPGAHSAS